MKKYIKFLICLLAVSLITFQACKKDNELTNPKSPTGDKQTENTSFNSKEIENMDEYLMNFMKKIKTQTRNAETMSVEDAQWHISACLNFMYCNANVDRTVVTYDTVYTSIMANDGCVSMNDINNSLQAISEKVSEVYNYSMLENKNILFIQPVILDETTRSGATVRTVVAMSGRDEEPLYYFTNWEFICLDTIFPFSEYYKWDEEAIEVLNFCIEYFIPSKPTEPNDERVYYTEIYSYSVNYKDGSGIYFNGENPNDSILGLNLARYLDSYLDIIIDNSSSIHDSSSNVRLTYISSEVRPKRKQDLRDNCIWYYHEIYLAYGLPVSTEIPSDNVVN